jgi:hypothetical protein
MLWRSRPGLRFTQTTVTLSNVLSLSKGTSKGDGFQEPHPSTGSGCFASVA